LPALFFGRAIAPDEVFGLAVRVTKLPIDFGHDRHVIAVPTQARRTRVSFKAAAQIADHPIGVPQMAQINRQVVATRRRRRCIARHVIHRLGFFEMQRPWFSIVMTKMNSGSPAAASRLSLWRSRPGRQYMARTGPPLQKR
jgi:hypothetical protein